MDLIIGDWLARLSSGFAWLALLAYGGAALWLALRPKALMARLMPSRAALVAAVAGTALWAWAWMTHGPSHTETAIAGMVRNLGFLTWLAASFISGEDGMRRRSTRLVVVTLIVINLVGAVFGSLALADLALSGVEAKTYWLTDGLRLVDMVTASGGLVLIEHCMRNRAKGLRMPMLVAAAGVAALWAYSLNIHLLGWLAGRPPEALLLIEPLAALAVLPTFILVALDIGRERVRLSRTIAVRTLAIMGLVTYLIIIALAGALARLVGGDYGDLAQGVLLAVALGGGGLMLLSVRTRAWLAVMVSKHFFEHRYDYRAEWMRFTATLEGGEGHDDALFRRVARALATLANSPGAILLIADAEGDYFIADHWRWPTALAPGHVLPVRAAFMLQESGRIIALDQLRDGTADAAEAEMVLPDWLLEDHGAWVLLPLLHLGRMVGMAVLQRPVAARPLDWEDLDVLRISSRQAASHIAEMQSQTALSEARRFDEFNRRFAFIMHDVKNLASQLGLLAANAERHADNPEFRADMIETLKLSVARMNELLHRLSAKGVAATNNCGTVDIAPLLDAVAGDASRRHPVSASYDPDLRAHGDGKAVVRILNHLLANAIDASAAGQPVLLIASAARDQVQIDVIDEGSGMSREFVRGDLFKPFVSTKDNGFGLGAFEALQLARAIGGRLEVESRPGEGTRFSLWLPRASAASLSDVRERAA